MNRTDLPADAESPWVFRLQLALLASFVLFATMVIAWVGRLIYVSWVWKDVFSASIGIALVAVPIFLFILVMFNYVFWGILLGRQEDRGQPS